MPLDATLAHLIGSASLRLSRRVEAIAYDDLDVHEQELLAMLRADSDFHGILRSRRPWGLTVRAIDRATAQLITGLGRGRPLSRDELASLGSEARRVVGRLILDGALEVRIGERFVSGAAAGQAVLGSEPPATQSHPLGILSLHALTYASLLRARNAATLAYRLYTYNTAPMTPRWRRRLPTDDHAATYLRLNQRSTRSLLARCWRLDEANPTNGWRYFRPRSRTGAPGLDGLTWKLYVSVGVAALGDVVPQIVRVLADCGGPYFKVGGDLYNLLRPDKFLIYFDSRDSMLACAEALSPVLAGIEPQGVPFTAPIGEDTALSWGVDPASERTLPAWIERDSWRTWVTNRLARYLRQARAARATDVEPRQYALTRLGLEGVDVQTWAPDASWRREFGEMDSS